MIITSVQLSIAHKLCYFLFTNLSANLFFYFLFVVQQLGSDNMLVIMETGLYVLCEIAYRPVAWA